MSRSNYASTGFAIFWALLIGIVVGAVAERRGLVPDFFAERRRLDAYVANSELIDPEHADLIDAGAYCSLKEIER